jgi:hypothetical protein
VAALAASSGLFDTDIATAVAALAAVITMTAAIVALRFAKRELSSNREKAQIELTFSLYDHQLDPEFAQHMAKTADFLRGSRANESGAQAAERKWAEWNKMNRGKRAEILLYLNHLEVVGGQYELGRLDEKAVMHLFGTAADLYWREGAWFVERARGVGTSKTFAKWGFLADAYRRQEEEGEWVKAPRSL